MVKKDLLASVKKIKDQSCELRLKLHVITKEEFIKITDRLYRDVCNLEAEISKPEETKKS